MSRDTPGSTGNRDWFFKLALWSPVFALSLAGATVLLVLQGSKKAPRARIEESEAPPIAVQTVRAASAPYVRENSTNVTPHAVTEPHFPSVTPSPSTTAAAGESALDADGQALFDELIEEDQQTLQPEDLEVDPTPPPLDLRTIKAYRDQNIDADGNLN